MASRRMSPISAGRRGELTPEQIEAKKLAEQYADQQAFKRYGVLLAQSRIDFEALEAVPEDAKDAGCLQGNGPELDRNIAVFATLRDVIKGNDGSIVKR